MELNDIDRSDLAFCVMIEAKNDKITMISKWYNYFHKIENNSIDDLY